MFTRRCECQANRPNWGLAVGLLAAGWLFTSCGGVWAAVLCPRIVSEQNADVSDLSRFRRYEKWDDKQEQELAVAVWQYLCSRETGLYHMNPVHDGADPWSEYSTVRDPIKILNIYNVGYCGIFGPTLDGIFQGLGFPHGRAFGVPNWNHCTTEVWYDGGWHYFDLDVRGALRKPDGSIASVAEAQTNRDLWVNPQRSIQPFFPKDPDKEKIFEIYRDSQIQHYYRWFQLGHVMDFRLRQGETLTRWWHPQAGRWHHHASYDQGFVRQLLEQEPRGYKSNHPDFSIWTQGNGLWHFKPNLTAASDDFYDAAFHHHNLVPAEDGLRLVSDGPAEVVFEVFTPWIIVPKVNDLDDPADDTEASVVTVEPGMELTLLVSCDHGKSWLRVAKIAGERKSIDLTALVAGTYGFLVKLQAEGAGNNVLLRSIEMNTWVQVAPISLPRLKRGRNRLEYAVGDRYDKQTMPMFVLPNVADPADLKRHVVEMPTDYDLTRQTARVRGDVTLQLDAPDGMLIDWFTAGACFNTHQGQAARNTANRIAFATDRPEQFQEIYRADVPEWVNHWRYQWDQDVQLRTPVKRAFVRYTGDPGVNVIRATVHLQPKRPPEQAVRITHAYKVGDQFVERDVDMQSPGDYELWVDGQPENVFIRMAVPSKTK